MKKNAIVNGKPFIEIIKELRSLTPKVSQKKGNDYIDIDEYKAALDTVLGIANHEHFIVGTPQIVTLQNGEMFTTCVVQLNVYDDDGNHISTHRAPGSVKFEVTNSTGNYSWPTNVATNAYASALKNACKALGVFADGKRKSTNNVSTQNDNFNNAALVGKKSVYTTNGLFRLLHKEGKDDVYKICVFDGDVEKELVIYQNKIDAILLKQLVNSVNIGSGIKYSIECSSRESFNSQYGRPQLILQQLYSYKPV